MPPALNPLLPGDRRRIGKLIHFALDTLWAQSVDSDPDNHGCCPRCCAPCKVIAELRDAGQLDDWVRAWPENCDNGWWDGAGVNREWLTRAWSRADTLNCHTEEAG